MDDEEKAAVRRIFGPPAEDDAEPVEDPPPSGHVPGEGAIPSQPRGEMTLREFADALFNPPPP